MSGATAEFRESPRSRRLGDREPRRTDLTTIHVKDRQTVEPLNPRSSVDVPPVRTPAHAVSGRVSVHKGPQATDRPALMLANRLGRAKEAEERNIHRARVTPLKHQRRFGPRQVRNLRMDDANRPVRSLEGDRNGHGCKRSTPSAALTFGNVGQPLRPRGRERSERSLEPAKHSTIVVAERNRFEAPLKPLKRLNRVRSPIDEISDAE